MKSGRVLDQTYLVVNLVNVPLYMIAFYFLKEIQIPRWFNQGKILYFVLSLFASSIVLYLVWCINRELWIDRLRGIHSNKFMNMVNFLTQTVQFYSPAMALLVWDSFFERRKEQDRIKALEKEKLTTELKFLKAQLNPHFLFNTLNNLYSFVINGSPKAPDMILRLSGILDYVLYKSQQQFVPIKSELFAIDNFIELEKIRHGERLEIENNWEGDKQTEISPLLLLSMVENAFKHGASGDIDHPKIDINISESKGLIRCTIWNTKSMHQGELNDEYKEGIGLSNIKRQLNLVYPDSHEISIKEDEKSYSISVTIKTKI